MIHTFSVGTLNTHFGRTRANDAYDLWRACERLDADVIGLQEVWWPRDGTSAAAAIADDLGYKIHEVPLTGASLEPRPNVHRDPLCGDGTRGQVLLSRLPFTPLQTQPLAAVPFDRSTRASIAVEVEVGTALVHVTCTHLTHRLYASPVHLGQLRKAAPDDGAAVILGDFNMWGPVVNGFMPGWRRAVTGRTWPSHRPHSQIDHVLIRGGIDVVRGEILPCVGSDHRPVKALLEVDAGRVRGTPAPPVGSVVRSRAGELPHARPHGWSRAA